MTVLINLGDFVKRRSLLDRPYKGKVVSVDDSMKLGAIKCEIPGLFTETDIDKLPWIFPRRVNNTYYIPRVGEYMEIRFPFDDVYSPFYYGTWDDANTHPDFFDGNYPNVYGFDDGEGTRLFFDRTGQQMRFEHASGVTAVMQPGGKFEIDSNGIALLQETINSLEQLSELLSELSEENHIGNLGAPTSAPLNFTAYLGIKGIVDGIKAAIESIKGSV